MYRLVCLFLFLVPCHAYGTTVVSLSVDKMSQEADLIVRGIVHSQNTQWNDAKNRIYTITKIEVAETYKGNTKSAKTISIRQIGGEIDGLVQTVAGNAKFAQGEEVLVFLESNSRAGIHFVMGMAQGKYSIDRAANPPTISRTMSSLHRVNVKKVQPMIHVIKRVDLVRQPTLVSLVGQIRSALVPSR